MRNAIISSLLKVAKQDKDVLLISGDIGYGVIDEFAQSLPDQFLNLGITEQSIASFAAGLARKNLKPYIYSINNFVTFRCLEQIRNDICYMGLPVTIIGVGAGLGYGNLGYSHFAIEDIAIMRSLPGLDVYSPAAELEATQSLFSIYEKEKPAYIRVGKGGEQPINNMRIVDVNNPITIIEGDDGVILSTGSIGYSALEAIRVLQLENIYPSLVSIPFLSQLSIENFLRLKPFERILTVEEHVTSGGFGSLILEAANRVGHKGKIKLLGVDLQKIDGRFGGQKYLLEESELSSRSIAENFKSLFKS